MNPIPTLVVQNTHRKSRPAESAGAPRCAAAPQASSWDETKSCRPRLATPDSSWDDVARLQTAPLKEIPCRHTFIHYSEPTPGVRRKRSLSTPALPLPNREWDLDFARQTACVPLPRCATPKPDVTPGVGAPELPAAPALPDVFLQGSPGLEANGTELPAVPALPAEDLQRCLPCSPRPLVDSLAAVARALDALIGGLEAKGTEHAGSRAPA